MNPSTTVTTKGTTAHRFWHSFRMAAWLGWQIESNWTDPFLFAVYAVARPVGAVLPHWEYLSR